IAKGFRQLGQFAQDGRQLGQRARLFPQLCQHPRQFGKIKPLVFRQQQTQRGVQLGESFLDADEVANQSAGLGRLGEFLNQRLHRGVSRDPIRSQFHDRGTECLHVIAVPFLACVVADCLERSPRVVQRREVFENLAPGRRDSVLGKIVTVLQRPFQTPERRLQKSENGSLKCPRLRQRVLSVVGREGLFPTGGFLPCPLERLVLCIQLGGE